jgi:hypothetical protein
MPIYPGSHQVTAMAENEGKKFLRYLNSPLADKKKREQFLKHLNAEDELGALIRGHLYIEAALIKLVEHALNVPGAFNVARLDFPRKVELAIALGVLEEFQKPALLQLNRLRNKFAHDVEATISPQDESELISNLSDRDRASFHERFGLRGVLALLWVRLEQSWQMRVRLKEELEELRQEIARLTPPATEAEVDQLLREIHAEMSSAMSSNVK